MPPAALQASWNVSSVRARVSWMGASASRSGVARGGVSRRGVACRRRSAVVTAPVTHASRVSEESAAEAWAWLRPLSSTQPAINDAQVAENAQRAALRPKYRPRTAPGTRSAIHEVQALLPATASAELAKAQARKIACLVSRARGRNGRQT